MIRFENRVPSKFRNIKADALNAPLVRLLSDYAAYGEYGLADLWVQSCGRTLTALICRADRDSMTVAVSDENADTNEIADFVRAVGARFVLCNVNLPLENGKKLTELFRRNSSKDNTQLISQSVDFRNVYRIQSQCFKMPDFDSFYADMSHRIRHGCAAAAVGQDSTACAKIYADSALIFAVCTVPQCRNQGNGARILKSIMSTIRSKNIFVLTDNEKAERFYVNNGFVVRSDAYEYIIGENDSEEKNK